MNGEQRRDEGMERAIRHAWDTWKQAFRDEVERLARTGKPFTSEDVTAQVGLPIGVVALSANNAVGALINGAARRGVIRKTGRRVQSKRPTSHAAELTEWVGAHTPGSLTEAVSNLADWTGVQDTNETGLSDGGDLLVHLAVEGGSMIDEAGAAGIVRLTLTTRRGQMSAFMGLADARRTAQAILEIVEVTG